MSVEPTFQRDVQIGEYVVKNVMQPAAMSAR
jgi:hypothetical protein